MKIIMPDITSKDAQEIAKANKNYINSVQDRLAKLDQIDRKIDERYFDLLLATRQETLKSIHEDVTNAKDVLEKELAIRNRLDRSLADKDYETASSANRDLNEHRSSTYPKYYQNNAKVGDPCIDCIDDRLAPSIRVTENRDYLKNANVKAFLCAIAEAEGGDYNLKYGGVKGKKNDKWTFTDFSTHPGAGSGGKTTAAGRYQINISTWSEMGKRMGLTDFSPTTQDLLAIEILRAGKVIDKIVAGDIDAALSGASRRWAALPEGKGKPGRYPQPYKTYDEFKSYYENCGGSIK